MNKDNLADKWSRLSIPFTMGCWRSHVFYECIAQSFNRATQGRPLRGLTKLPRSDGACLRRIIFL